MTKTSEIYKALKAAEKPFTRKDMVYAREHRKEEDIRKELINIRLNTVWNLEKRGCVIETPQGYQLTDDGLSLLIKYKEKITEFGRSNVEFTLKMKGEKIIYEVKTVRGAKPKIKPKAQPSPVILEPSEDIEYDQRKDNMISFLSGEYRHIDRESIREEDDFLTVKTRISYHRTTGERNKLDEVGKALGMKIESDRRIDTRNYECKIGDKTLVTLVSERKGRSLQSLEPLEIKVNLKEPIEPSQKFIKALIEKFHPSKKVENKRPM